jgi:hypothetical protein
VKAARRVRRAAWGNGPAATLVPRPRPTQLLAKGERWACAGPSPARFGVDGRCRTRGPVTPLLYFAAGAPPARSVGLGRRRTVLPDGRDTSSGLRPEREVRADLPVPCRLLRAAPVASLACIRSEWPRSSLPARRVAPMPASATTAFPTHSYAAGELSQRRSAIGMHQQGVQAAALRTLVPHGTSLSARRRLLARLRGW